MKPKVLENWMWNDNLPCLGVDIYDRSLKYNYSIKFYRLYSISGNRVGEVTLKEGRFHAYTEKRQEHGVQLRKEASQQELHEWFDRLLDWLAENVEDQWSLDLEVHDVHHVEFDFRFADVSTAVIFRFLFQ
jgi:hypothetical protein